MLTRLITSFILTLSPIHEVHHAEVPHHPRVTHRVLPVRHAQRVHHGGHSLVSAQVMALTSNVNRCEESGDWHVNGPTYFGGLGWLWATWQEWRQPTDPLNMAYATPQEQARAMARFVGHVMGGWWPDSHGCTGGY